MKKQNEYHLQKQVSAWLTVAHNDILFLSDTIAGLKLTIPQQVRNKAIQKHGFKCPDILILKPSNNHSGLFIELKTESPFKKNGELKKNEHLEAQQKSINDLLENGYYACFSWSLNQTVKIIESYLKDEL